MLLKEMFTVTHRFLRNKRQGLGTGVALVRKHKGKA